MPATLDIILPNAVADGAILLDFLLIADTLDGLGIEREGTLGDKCSEENDGGADAELDTTKTHQHVASAENGQGQNDSPSDPLQTSLNITVSIEVIVNDSSEDGTQNGVHDDVRGIQEGHHRPEGGDVNVLGS